VTPLHMLSDKPSQIDCPFCEKRTMVKIHKVGTSMQAVVGVILCLFCIFLACLPCLCGMFENTEYFCSNCNQKVAQRPHDGPIQTFAPQSDANMAEGITQYHPARAPSPTARAAKEPVPTAPQAAIHGSNVVLGQQTLGYK
jgi:DNA-directed RNA polymerase subunit RPC12/RpoP